MIFLNAQNNGFPFPVLSQPTCESFASKAHTKKPVADLCATCQKASAGEVWGDDTKIGFYEIMEAP